MTTRDDCINFIKRHGYKSLCSFAREMGRDMANLNKLIAPCKPDIRTCIAFAVACNCNLFEVLELFFPDEMEVLRTDREGRYGVTNMYITRDLGMLMDEIYEMQELGFSKDEIRDTLSNEFDDKEIIAKKIWCREDIKTVLEDEYGYEDVTDEMIDRIVVENKSLLREGLGKVALEEWETLNNAIVNAGFVSQVKDVYR